MPLQPGGAALRDMDALFVRALDQALFPQDAELGSVFYRRAGLFDEADHLVDRDLGKVVVLHSNGITDSPNAPSPRALLRCRIAMYRFRQLRGR